MLTAVSHTPAGAIAASVLRRADQSDRDSSRLLGTIADAIPAHNYTQVIHTISNTQIAREAKRLCRGKRRMSVPTCGMWSPIGNRSKFLRHLQSR